MVLEHVIRRRLIDSGTLRLILSHDFEVREPEQLGLFLLEHNNTDGSFRRFLVVREVFCVDDNVLMYDERDVLTFSGKPMRMDTDHPFVSDINDLYDLIRVASDFYNRMMGMLD